MKAERILYHNYGEISYTSMIPQKPAGDLPDDYTKQDIRLFSSDDWRLTECTVSEVRTVEIPDWMPAETFCKDHLRLHWIWTAHKSAKTTLTHQQTAALIFIYERSENHDLLVECVKLLCANLRSTFKQSLKDQLVTWIDQLDEGTNKYNLPFSPKQTAALTAYSQGYRRH